MFPFLPFFSPFFWFCFLVVWDGVGVFHYQASQEEDIDKQVLNTPFLLGHFYGIVQGLLDYLVVSDVNAGVQYSWCKTTMLLEERFYSCLCVLEAEMFAVISTNASAYLRLQWKFNGWFCLQNCHYVEGCCHALEMWKACVVCWVEGKSGPRNNTLTILWTSFLLVGVYRFEQPLCLLAGQCLMSAV